MNTQIQHDIGQLRSQELVIEEAKVFADQYIRPLAREHDATGKLSRTLINEIAKRGYLGATFPAEYSGLELDPVYYGMLNEEIGKACSSTRALLTVGTSLIGESILRWGTTDQKKKWLPLISSAEKIGAFALTEPKAGTDAKGIESSYEKDGDSYIITGHKKWITLAGIADFFLVIAKNAEQQISAFLVDRNPDIEIKEMLGLMAAKGSHIAEVKFNRVRVPKENLLGAEGRGFSCIVSTALDHGRYSIAWAGVALAQEALEAMVNYARQRKQFGKKIYQFQLIRGIIADSITEIHAARALCLRAGELRKQMEPESIVETTVAKYFSSKVAMKVTMDAVQVHGGNGCYNEYPVERLFREAKVLEIIEGTSQIQQEMIASYALREYYNGKKTIE